MDPADEEDTARWHKQQKPTEEGLALSLASHTADLSDEFIKAKGAFTVVLSGGYLIDNLRKLKEPSYVGSVDWSKWHLFWLDERVVPKCHPDSNYKLAVDGFLSSYCQLSLELYQLISQVPIPAENVYAINDTLPAEGSAEDYENCLRQLVQKNVVPLSTATGFPKFDLMLLGMGPDGHVASLFPGHPLLDENKRQVTYIKDSPKQPPERITFTFPVINSSDYIAIVVAGPGEVDAVAKVLGNGGGDGNDGLPARMVSTECELTWFLDKDAAAKL